MFFYLSLKTKRHSLVERFRQHPIFLASSVFRIEREKRKR